MKIALIGAWLALAACTRADAPHATPTAHAADPSGSAATPEPSEAASPSASPVSDGALPGSSVSVKDAVAVSTSVVLAKLTARGTPSPDAPAEAFYDGGQAVIVRTLTGRRIEGTIALTYKVKSKPAAPVSESPPSEGEEYILFLREERADSYRVEKILRATSDHLAAVEKGE